MTPCADVSGVIAMGVLQVISDPRTNLAQSLNTLLTAELADNAGWELLIDLANAGGHASLAEGQVHLETVRSWLKSELMS